MEVSDITDEMLTAFLDGEVDPQTSTNIVALLENDPALAARLEALKIPMPVVREAFDRAMEAAPKARLEEVLEKQSSGRPADDRRPWFGWGRQITVAATILAFAIGLISGRITWQPDSNQDWRVAVAEYQALYSKDTLGSIEPDAAEADKAIQRVASKIGAPILPETLVSLDRLTFKRAQTLRWGSAPLAQFAFLSDLGEPFALCATSANEANRPIENEQLKDLATASWVQDGVAYMVIGGSDPAFVAAVAGQVRERL